ncbi:hypothetical protein EPA93_21025 [Ktedonosporobacter rubrisoli]|uniref:Glycoside hydrolase family 5 domain-containing protein n=1 Tax=Ktedonosporobacter rubrisoli TaxID=2509675 RepID=A0A4P6JTV8_KTERU|nr:hypothetical protein [Ktedonosporobacter rubrisoli]QBD78346.1 hypothetical protein EPA93_21025 [Ktedonosporobacter rubrisoli]
MKFRSCATYSLALTTIVGGVLLQWILLSGNNPFSMLASLLPNNQHAPARVAGMAISPPATHLWHPGFEAGIIFPRPGQTAYGIEDPTWQTGLRDIHEQTGARWIQITVELFQPSLNSTQVTASTQTATPQAIREGIRAAHQNNYLVFVSPHLIIDGKEHRAGQLHYTNQQQLNTWFSSYWQALRPYIVAAQEEHAEQFSLGTELTGLEHVPVGHWNQLITQAHALFHGKLTYSMHWTYQTSKLPGWMRHPFLNEIGIAAYYPLATAQQQLSDSGLNELWQQKAGLPLDAIATQLKKPVLISAIGYRDRADALLHPEQSTTNAPINEGLQAEALNAALSYCASDPHIAGIFVWGWSVPHFQPNRRLAAPVIKHWYSAINS